MAMAMITGSAIAGVTLLTNTLLTSNGGTNFGQETLTNSTIGHEEKNNRSSTFFLTLKMEILH